MSGPVVPSHHRIAASPQGSRCQPAVRRRSRARRRSGGDRRGRGRSGRRRCGYRGRSPRPVGRGIAARPCRRGRTSRAHADPSKYRSSSVPHGSGYQPGAARLVHSDSLVLRAMLAQMRTLPRCSGAVPGGASMNLGDVATPALVVDGPTLETNLATMAAARPGSQCRPHVKAHKTTALARRQAAVGHVGLHRGDAARGARPGCRRPRRRPAARERDRRPGPAARDGGVRRPGDRRGRFRRDRRRRRPARDPRGARRRERRAPPLRVRARATPASSRTGRVPRASRCAASWGTRVTSTCSRTATSGPRRRRPRWRSSRRRTTASAATSSRPAPPGPTTSTRSRPRSRPVRTRSWTPRSLPLTPEFRPALWVEATVISVSPGYAVADCGLKALGMDHGNPTVDDARVLFVSDEHITFRPDRPGARRRPHPGLARARGPDGRLPRADARGRRRRRAGRVGGRPPRVVTGDR